MTTNQCVVCTRDSPHAYVCDHCITTNLAGGLRTLAWLGAQLLVTYTRQDRLASSGGSTVSTPLGYNENASHTYAALHNALSTWVRDWIEAPGVERWPHDTVASMARWLIDRVDRLRQDPDADHFAIEIERHAKAALLVINPLDQNEQTFGICGEERRDGTACTAYLYGAPKADWVRCKACKTQHDTRRRIQALERRMRVMYFRAATLARLLPRLTERPVTANNIRSWVFNGRPIRTQTDNDGYVTYHTGDVIAVANATPTRNRTKAVSA